MGIRLITAAALLYAALGCSDRSSLSPAPTGFARVTRDGVTGSVENGVLAVRNGTATPIVVSAVETTYFYTAFALWCFGHDQCGTLLAPGATLRILVAEIPGFTPNALSTEVFWWVRGSDPARVNAIRVPLRR